MSGLAWASGSLVESRHRSSGVHGDAKDQSHGNHFKDINKPSVKPTLNHCTRRKFHFLKFVVAAILCGTIVTLLRYLSMNQEEGVTMNSHSRFLDVGWLWNRSHFDDRYISQLDVNWIQTSKALEKSYRKDEILRIALLNFNVTEVNQWQQLLHRAETNVVHLEHATSDMKWEDLYPEWIDEEEEYEVPICPSLPKPKISGSMKFDLIAAKLPCKKQGIWARDIARLHLHLAAAELAAQSAAANGSFPVHVLLVTDCFPIPNLFTCKDLVMREGNSWLFKPDSSTMREKLQLPVGSCRLALPFHEVRSSLPEKRTGREAYATILHSANVYVCGAIAVAQSIRMSGSTRDLIILVDETISNHHRDGLEAAGWKVRTIQRIRNPKAERDAYNEWNYSKFRLWQLSDYDKIIFIDADLIILRNIDPLFSMPEITATGNNATLFNSGVMVIEPSNCTFQLLMDHIDDIESYNGGDQGYLNEIFTWWHRVPSRMNFLKHFWEGDEEEKKQRKTQLFDAEPPTLYVLHYLGMKPWLCFRDYDCNWNVDVLQEFASDAAHARWWKVHDAMPEYLQSFCLLRSKQKAALEWDRRQAEKARYPDGHWRRKITDPRLSVCFEEFCFWESMLWHWGETNWTEEKKALSMF